MIFKRAGRINKDQKGFTLIEVVVALTISGLIVGAIAVTIYQVFGMNALASSRMSAIIQVQNAGHWVTRDAMSAQVIRTDIPGIPGELVRMTWTEWDGTQNSVTYTLRDDNLWRFHSRSGVAPSHTLVARYIDPAGTHFAWDGGRRELTFTVTAIVDDFTQEKRVYRITPRAGFVR
jgi:prepilin-type N-terminal cleavage/methylation domain-containing protein